MNRRLFGTQELSENLKLQSCKLRNDKYMIASTQITNIEILAFGIHSCY